MKHWKFAALLSFALFFFGCATTHAQMPTLHQTQVELQKSRQAVVQVLHTYSVLNINDSGNLILDSVGNPTTKPETAIGTGAVVDVNGFVITNNHVITPHLTSDPVVNQFLSESSAFPDTYFVCTIVAEQSNCSVAVVAATDVADDLALLYTKHPLPRAVEFRDSTGLMPQEEVYMWGNVLDFIPLASVSGRYMGTMSKPYYTSPSPFLAQLPLLIVDITTINGFSGGPMFDTSGKCIGLEGAHIPADFGRPVGVAIPSNTVVKFWEDNKPAEPKKK